MADNITVTPGTGASIGADEISSVKYQRIKMILGADGTNDGDVSSANPLPVTASALPLPTGAATSAKQLADNHNVVVTSAPTTAVTNAGITSIDSKTPALGQALAAASVPVILPSATITTLTPPAAITGFALEATLGTVHGHVDSIDTKITACNTGAVVLAAGTAGIGKLTANSGVDIGDVDIASIAAGDNNIGNVDIVTMPTNVPTTIGSGTTTVTTAGTRVALAASTACRKVIICAKDTNTGKIYYGGSSVSATSGAFLYAGGSVSLDISNLASVYIDAGVNGEGVLFTYVA
jgi:hypothetical protein